MYAYEPEAIAAAGASADGGVRRARGKSGRRGVAWEELVNREESRLESGRFLWNRRGMAYLSLATVPLVAPEARSALRELRS